MRIEVKAEKKDKYLRLVYIFHLMIFYLQNLQLIIIIQEVHVNRLDVNPVEIMCLLSYGGVASRELSHTRKGRIIKHFLNFFLIN